MNKNINIGTYNERTLHSALKKFFESDTDKHEVPYKGYIADIKNESGIIEIQTGSFRKMLSKLTVFLEEDDVTVVYPAVRKKWIVWIDAETGEITDRRKSPKSGTVWNVLPELYGIREVITDKRLKIKIVEVDVEEYKRLDGWSKDKKKGATKVERIPVGIGETITLEAPEDYKKLIPFDTGIKFTQNDFGKVTKLAGIKQWEAVRLLTLIGVLDCENVGTGRAKKFIYSVAENQTVE